MKRVMKPYVIIRPKLRHVQHANDGKFTFQNLHRETKELKRRLPIIVNEFEYMAGKNLLSSLSDSEVERLCNVFDSESAKRRCEAELRTKPYTKQPTKAEWFTSAKKELTELNEQHVKQAYTKWKLQNLSKKRVRKPRVTLFSIDKNQVFPFLRKSKYKIKLAKRVVQLDKAIRILKRTNPNFNFVASG